MQNQKKCLFFCWFTALYKPTNTDENSPRRDTFTYDELSQPYHGDLQIIDQQISTGSQYTDSYAPEVEEYIYLSSLDDYLYVNLPTIYITDNYSIPILETYSQPTTDQNYQSKSKYSNIQQQREQIPREIKRLIHPDLQQTQSKKRGVSCTKKGAYGGTYLTCYSLSLAIRTIRKSTIKTLDLTITEPSLAISSYL